MPTMNNCGLPNFSAILEAISHPNRHDEFKALLCKKIQSCGSYYVDIQKIRDEAKDVINSVLASRKEKQDLINKVKSNIIKLNSLMLENVPDEKIELLREEIYKRVALENNFVALQVEKEKMAAVNNTCALWVEQLGDETAELLSLVSQGDLIELLKTLSIKLESGDGDEGLKMDIVSIKKLESSICQYQDRFKCEMDEMNKIMDAFQKEINAAAIEAEESEMLSGMFDRDWRNSLMQLYFSDNFRDWAASKCESAQKVTELDEPNKKLVTETATLEQTQDLSRDLQKNSIWNKDELVSHPLFQVYQMDLANFDNMKKKREKRDQEMKLLLEKLEIHGEVAE